MNDFLIQEYIKRLTVDDIKNFALKEGIDLNDEETAIIYKYLKDYWRTLLHGNPKGLLQELKLQLSEESYNKIEKLYVEFKNRING